VELSLSGKPGTKLASNLGSLGQAQSVFGGLSGEGAAVRTLVNVALPENLRKALSPLIDEAIAKSLEKEENKDRRDKAKAILSTLEPTLKSGALDMVLDLRPPTGEEKNHTMIVGLGVKDGKGIEKAIKNLLPELPPGDREKIKVDFAEADGIKIHQVQPDKDATEQTRDIFGDNPFYFAVKNDAVLVGLGSDGLAELKKALQAKPGKTAQIGVELNVSRLVTAMSLNPTADKAALRDAAKEAFGDAAGKDRVQVIVSGGDSLKARMGVNLSVMKFFALVQKAQMKN
jgi:hypothetical protein